MCLQNRRTRNFSNFSTDPGLQSIEYTNRSWSLVCNAKLEMIHPSRIVKNIEKAKRDGRQNVNRIWKRPNHTQKGPKRPEKPRATLRAAVLFSKHNCIHNNNRNNYDNSLATIPLHVTSGPKLQISHNRHTSSLQALSSYHQEHLYILGARQRPSQTTSAWIGAAAIPQQKQ